MQELLYAVSFSIGVVGSIVILLGIIHVTILGAKNMFGKGHKHEREQDTLDSIRIDLGRYIVLGLEFFIAKDIIETLIVPSWDDMLLLGALVIIRTVLSFFLTREIHQTEERTIAHRKIDARIK